MSGSLKGIQAIQPLCRVHVHVWEFFGDGWKAADDFGGALPDLRAVWDFAEVGIVLGSGAEEEDAEEDEDGKARNDLKAAVEVGAWVSPAHSVEGGEGAVQQLCLLITTPSVGGGGCTGSFLTRG